MKHIYHALKIRDSDTKYQSLPYERLACQHLQDTIIKYLTGLSENATRWQKKLDKKYGNLTQVTKRIDYDLKHGVEKQEVLAFLELIKTDQSYSELRKANDFGYRFDSLEADFLNRDSKANHSLSFTDY